MRRFTVLLVMVIACARDDGDGDGTGLPPGGRSQVTNPGAAPGSSGASTAPGGQRGGGGESTGAAAQSRGLPIGAACTQSDGYVQQFPPCTAPAGATGPTACPPPNAQQYPSYWELAPGIGYCLTGQPFPHGYFTMNCAANSDCPDGTLCDGVCRKPCTSDDECATPTTCLAPPRNPNPRFVRHCVCVECVPSGGL